MKQIIRFPPLCTVKELLRLYRITALKKLSQNFLLNPRLTWKIVKASGLAVNSQVCEVGPGPGAITRSIMMTYPSKLVVIEKDTRFKPILEELARSAVCPFEAIYADILDFDLAPLFDSYFKTEWDDKSPKICLIGNLPFSVSTPLIIQWLKDISLKRSAWAHGRVPMTLTFQEEVAKRIVAPPFSKSRCRLSIMCQNWCSVEHEMSIPGTAFLPKPKVDIGVVNFEPLVTPIIPLEFHLIEKVLRAAFNSRKKLLPKTVCKLFPLELRDELTEKLLSVADVPANIRPFQISMEGWRGVCFAYKEICDRDPRLYLYNFRGRKNQREIAWKYGEAVEDLKDDDCDDGDDEEDEEEEEEEEDEEESISERQRVEDHVQMK